MPDGSVGKFFEKAPQVATKDPIDVICGFGDEVLRLGNVSFGESKSSFELIWDLAH